MTASVQKLLQLIFSNQYQSNSTVGTPEVLVLTMYVVDGCDMGHVAVIAFTVLYGALAQRQYGTGSAPPCVPAGRGCS